MAAARRTRRTSTGPARLSTCPTHPDMQPYLLKLSYLLRRYHFVDAPLDRWIAVLLVFMGGLMAIRWLPGGLAGALLCLLLAIAVVLAQRAAQRGQYVVFQPDDPGAQTMPGAQRLQPADKLALHATGLFEVEGKAQRFSELPAQYRSFSTREHALIAVVAPSRRLAGAASWPARELGMWYIFFRDSELRQVQPGVLRFGSAKRPALRLQLEQAQPDKNAVMDAWGLQWGGAKDQRKTRQKTIYLSFDDAAQRARVMADLAADAGA